MANSTAPEAEAGTGAARDEDSAFDALAFDVFAQGCPSRSILEHVTGRWGALVLGGLAEGPMRFNGLRRRVSGVSEKMLAQALHALERDGFVSRDVQSTIPPRVEYALTDLGRETAAVLRTLVNLIESRAVEVLAAQERYDAARGAAARPEPGPG
ncbi:helix-turn-helix transcriptional regulator [Frankia sp. CNm7]|uniref:Helix-turn-helix transcriptional regulator n=1 Tax=Frankia nepalensis TaxID=1836974 RepID=A0A937RI23_9ACTN|nr:helix-turn-helix domain-containing protein [Frankia nepalensis]MBL7502054.1 helix-turn-helix transcriptional regulator [Frankia nepalensis]MBL7511960.1 helix-turn-helix transcriptional regulator [Frankia nepalensis]MBL7524050.1 helix-turn-helix transcriptional regulator [Frankia nepalensis]MBL7630552.1 helix-turn-helix transcriptional regulator [Frankia nepalensis]